MKFGRKPAVRTLKSLRSALALARHLDPLGKPPAASGDWTKAVDQQAGPEGWRMFKNDAVGDCVYADTAHTLMLRTANAGKIVIPTDDDVIAAYSAGTGYNPADPSTDQGADENKACADLVSVGFLGHHAESTASVDPGNLDHVRWCVQLFGHCRLGIYVTQRMMEQFDRGEPWGTGGRDRGPVLGGHDVPLVTYDRMFHAVTWGKMHPIHPDFFGRYGFCEEAHAELFFDWIKEAGTAPNNISLADLVADLKHVGGMEEWPPVPA